MKVLFFFKFFGKFERTFTVLGEKVFWQGYQNSKMHFSSHKNNQKIKLLKVLFFYQFLQNFERTFTVRGGKFLGMDIKNENCTLSLQSIMLRIKIIFDCFVSFPFIRNWNKTFLDLWQQSFHPGWQKGILGVYMSPLRDVGIIGDMTWRETFFEPWRENFDLFPKTSFYVSEGRF